jgi:hypothetical protein
VANELENIMKSTNNRNNSELASRIFSFLEEKYIYTSWFVMVSDGNETETNYLTSEQASPTRIHTATYNGTFAAAVPFLTKIGDVVYILDLFPYLKSTVYLGDSDCAVGSYLYSRMAKWLRYSSLDNCPSEKKFEDTNFC